MTNALQIHNKLLLCIYLVIPAACIFVVLDVYVFDEYTKYEFPLSPQEWYWWILIFGYPHIIASMVTLADKEYISFYKRDISKAILVAIILAVVAPMVIGRFYAFFIVAYYTMHHVMMQQFGIVLMMLKKKPDSNYKIFSFLSILSMSTLYAVLYAEENIGMSRLFDITAIAVVSSIVFAYIFYKKELYGANLLTVPMLFFLCNVLIVPVCYLFAINGYSIFTIMIPRLIHDITAYIVYMIHDKNRNKEKAVNFIYKPFYKLKIHPFIVCILLSIVIAYPLSMHEDSSRVIEAVAMFCAYFHYYMEARMWKNSSMHRKYVEFV